MKRAFAARAVPGGTGLHFHMRYLLKTKNETAEKIIGQCFHVKSKVTCKNLAHLEEKKNNGLKSHFQLVT